MKQPEKRNRDKGAITTNSIDKKNYTKTSVVICYEYYLTTYWASGAVTNEFLGIGCEGEDDTPCALSMTLAAGEATIRVSTNCGSEPELYSGGGSTNTFGDHGPKICLSSIILTPQGSGSVVNQAKI